MEAPPGGAVLLSIRPRFANLIIEGSKTVEFRRTRPRVGAGDTVFLYASSPVKAVLASFEVTHIREGHPEELWAAFHVGAGLDRTEYDAYFTGAEVAIGIEVGRVATFEAPIPLADLRAMWEGFTAPQSYRYLGVDEHGDLLAHLALPCGDGANQEPTPTPVDAAHR